MRAYASAWPDQMRRSARSKGVARSVTPVLTRSPSFELGEVLVEGVEMAAGRCAGRGQLRQPPAGQLRLDVRGERPVRRVREGAQHPVRGLPGDLAGQRAEVLGGEPGREGPVDGVGGRPVGAIGVDPPRGGRAPGVDVLPHRPQEAVAGELRQPLLGLGLGPVTGVAVRAQGVEEGGQPVEFGHGDGGYRPGPG
ncbi:hypothetical protein GTY62_06200 [Streptomyces sp. SID724]|nr:hypothetical protein [Streptomyces sp. SID724]